MPDHPTGTVTFLFTDIEGSTQLWERHHAWMDAAHHRHEAILRAAIAAHGGWAYKQIGDAFQAAFQTAPAALAAAVAAQGALTAEDWNAATPTNSKLKTQNSKLTLRVRMALHTGTTEERADDYLGPLLNRVARLMAAGHGGQVLLTLATAELVRDTLPAGVELRDLGERRLKDLTRPERVWQVLGTGLPADFPPLRTLDARPTNLPQQLTSFVGRAAEMVEVQRLLAAIRLLTLTGTGGAGKTRLSLQVAANLVDDFVDGVWLVELAPLADPTLVPQTVAGVLSVREEPARPLAMTLGDRLRDKRLLLLLDNCEHLVEACARLADTLLRACPGLRILATSREALGIAGETTYRVPPLTLPDPAHLPPIPALGQYEAVRLFIDRALAVRPGFQVTNANAPALAHICARLDGIPLAIELAAARVRALPVEQIAGRLDDRFRLLTGGSRTALPRQQTLRALIDWSYDLLPAAEQVLLCRLAVFVGGWTLATAEAVCAAEGVAEDEVCDLLTHLVDKSLVGYEEDGAGGARYRLLETIREYAAGKLATAADGPATQDRHLAYFTRLAEDAEPHLLGSQQLVWLPRLDAEHDNLRAALDWAAERGAAALGARLAAGIRRFWEIRGFYSEGRRRLAEAVRAGQALPARLRAGLLDGLALLARRQGDYGAYQASCEELLALWNELGNKYEIARALNGLALAFLDQGDADRAQALLADSLRLRRELNDRGGIAQALNNLGEIARMRGDSLTARALYEESLALRRALGDRTRIVITASNLALMLHALGDEKGATALFLEGVTLARNLGDRWHLAGCLAGLAAIAVAVGDASQGVRAARLLGASTALLAAAGGMLHPPDRDLLERSIAAARAQVAEATFAAAWAAGGALTLDEAVALALEEAPPDA